MFLTKREPGPEAIQKGIDSLLAGLRARHPGYTFRVVSPPDGLLGTGAMGARHVDGAGVIGPDDHGSIGSESTTAPPNEDMADHRQEVA